jgi:cAMP-regulated phosphoprotein/endosulfine conserved region
MSSGSSASMASFPTRRIYYRTSSRWAYVSTKTAFANTMQERKYFDSGDYALSKAGKASDTGVTTIGTEHPNANDIPHMSPLTNTVSRGDSFSAGSPPSNPPEFPSAAALHRGSINGIPGGGLPGFASRSPVKESSYLARSASMDEHGGRSQSAVKEGSGANALTTSKEQSMSPPPRQESIPIRR